jgi:hypothetical protein
MVRASGHGSSGLTNHSHKSRVHMRSNISLQFNGGKLLTTHCMEGGGGAPSDPTQLTSTVFSSTVFSHLIGSERDNEGK